MIKDDNLAPNRVVGLVIHLLKEIRDQRIQLDDMDDVSDELLGQGYTESEIDAAMSWVYSRLEDNQPADLIYQSETQSHSFRVLHNAEMSLIRADAYGLLLEMLNLRLLSIEDIEKIIERVMSYGTPVTSDELLIIAHQFLFEGQHMLISRGLMNFTQPSSTIN